MFSAAAPESADRESKTDKELTPFHSRNQLFVVWESARPAIVTSILSKST